jgi:hypothetical protein
MPGLRHRDVMDLQDLVTTQREEGGPEAHMGKELSLTAFVNDHLAVE